MTITVAMTVNGKAVSGKVEARTLFVQFLREHLGMTGTHVGCDTSQCGACVVHVDGKSVKSCTMLAVQAEGAKVLTIEGLAASADKLHPMQEAFRENHALQCGFCTPGMVMSAIDMVKRHNYQLDEQTVRRELEGNLCRCTGYHNIVKAILAAAPSHEVAGVYVHDRRDRYRRPVLRTEDQRFLTGNGHYVDDLELVRCTHAYFLRSPHAHARIKSIDIAAAKKMPGVVRIFTGKDTGRRQGRRPDLRLGGQGQARPAAQGAGPSGDGVGDRALCRRHRWPWWWPRPTPRPRTPPRRSRSTTRCCRPTSILVKALDKGMPRGPSPRRRAISATTGRSAYKADVDAAFAKAAHVTKLDIVNNRLIPNAMEPRAAAANTTRGTGHYTLWSTSQNPHVLRLILSAFVLGIPEHKLRVIAPDVGGGFGSKIFCYAEETMVHLGGGQGRPADQVDGRAQRILP